MKKSISFLVAALLMVCSNAFAQTKTATFQFEGNPMNVATVNVLSNKSNIENYGVEDVILTTGGDKRPSMFLPGGMPASMAYLCMQSGSELTFNALGYEIKKIVMTFRSSSQGVIGSYDKEEKGEISSFNSADNTRTWTADAGSKNLDAITIISTGSSTAMLKAVVTYEKASATGGSGDLGFEDETIIPTNTRLLIRQRTYGDVMGEASTSKVTAEKVYYYNRNLQLRRIINTKPELNGLIFNTTDYMNYEYKNGLLDNVSQWQYGVYTYGERDVKKSNTGNITYKYDANGRCIEMNDDGLVTKYEYNADGFVVKKIEPSGKTAVYDELTADGKPLHATVRPAYSHNLGDSYEEIYTYDAQGNLASLLRQHDEDLRVLIADFGGFKQYDEVYAGDFVSEEEYTYVNGFLKEKMVYGMDYQGTSAEGKVPESRTIYNMVNGNPNIIHYYTLGYDQWGGGWDTKAAVEFEDEYQDFSDYRDLENRIVSLEQSKDEPNTALVEFNLPQRAETDPALGMNVYRNGEFLQTFYLINWESYDYNNLSYDAEKKTFTFYDRNLKNGNYEYFVETVRSFANSDPDIDPDEPDAGGMVTPLTYVPSYIVSNVATIKIYTDLPSAENLKTRYVRNSSDVTIMFEMPADAQMYGFQSNWLMVDNGQLAEMETNDINVSELKCDLTPGDHTVYILTRYKLGYAISQRITVNIANTPDVETAIRDVNANDKAVIYDLMGRKVTNNYRGIKVINGKKALK